ncbi:MAG: hypothetical protein RL514_4457 [Verrucomicrobiota bacterium]|jgi:hypothetical protein
MPPRGFSVLRLFTGSSNASAPRFLHPLSTCPAGPKIPAPDTRLPSASSALHRSTKNSYPGLSPSRSAFSPLPAGEGKGEGERQRGLDGYLRTETTRPVSLTPALSRWEREEGSLSSVDGFRFGTMSEHRQLVRWLAASSLLPAGEGKGEGEWQRGLDGYLRTETTRPVSFSPARVCREREKRMPRSHIAMVGGLSLDDSRPDGIGLKSIQSLVRHLTDALLSVRTFSFPSTGGVPKARNYSFPSARAVPKARKHSFPSEIAVRKARHCSFLSAGAVAKARKHSFPSEIVVRKARHCSFPSARAVLRIFDHSQRLSIHVS